MTTSQSTSHAATTNPSSTSPIDDIMSSLFRPPIVRTGTAALNRALFTKKIPLAAAAVHDARLIAAYRKRLHASKELLDLDRVSPIAKHPDPVLADQGKKCFLLEPNVRPEKPETWGPVVREGVQKEELGVVNYELVLGYEYWSYRDIMLSILPEELHGDIPAGFNVAGHVAHLNLREAYLPYKYLVAEVLLDKNPQIRTVINKVDNVGRESEFRTFAYEVLAGPDDLNVSVAEHGCTFEFDYSKVYWNSKLETEHRRIVGLFKPGEVVCDVMAGIGPFAVPAGKKGVFVWANDKNPESYRFMQVAIKRNKVAPFVRPFCEDGRTFIRRAAADILAASQRGEHAVVPIKTPKDKQQPPQDDTSESKSRSPSPKRKPRPTTQRIPLPPTISHFVMNLPASAISFLSAYRGVYHAHESLFTSHEGPHKLPLIHVHCFAVKPSAVGDDESIPRQDILNRIQESLRYPVYLAEANEDANKKWAEDVEVMEKVLDGEKARTGKEGAVLVHYVRDVAPAKSMYCASFRLPAEVAFAEPGELKEVRVDGPGDDEED